MSQATMIRALVLVAIGAAFAAGLVIGTHLRPARFAVPASYYGAFEALQPVEYAI